MNKKVLYVSDLRSEKLSTLMCPFGTSPFSKPGKSLCQKRRSLVEATMITSHCDQKHAVAMVATKSKGELISFVLKNIRGLWLEHYVKYGENSLIVEDPIVDLLSGEENSDCSLAERFYAADWFEILTLAGFAPVHLSTLMFVMVSSGIHEPKEAVEAIDAAIAGNVLEFYKE